MNDDGGSAGLDGEIQLGRPIVPCPPVFIRHSGCRGNRGICLLEFLWRVLRRPECYPSALATVIFTPVGVPIKGAPVAVIAVCPHAAVNAMGYFRRQREKTYVLW